MHFAEVVKLVDTHVSGACGASYAGSSPAFGTNSQPVGPPCLAAQPGIPTVLFLTAEPPIAV